MKINKQNSRRDFIKKTGLVALATGVTGSITLPTEAKAKTKTKTNDKAKIKKLNKNGPYNILMIVTDQERHMKNSELPEDYTLPGHERLMKQGVVFENHQVASCVCTPSRAVLYTGKHIQQNGMFDNTNFPWSGSLKTDVGTIGDLLREEGYYTAYKGKWHLTEEFETVNKLHAPKKILVDEMEKYGFSDYFGAGDIIAHTQGGYLHDDVITSMSTSWLRGKAQQLNNNKKPWFMAVNLVNPHDIMYYDTDLPGEKKQTKNAMMRMNTEPKNSVYQNQWNVKLSPSRNHDIQGKDRPNAHLDYQKSRGVMVGIIPNEDERWKRHNNYYLNCIKDVDKKIVSILDELEDLGMAENTIVIFTSDHGELAGAHGLSGKGATAYREQNNVPFIISHPAYEGNKRCEAVTSHVDIATTLVSMSGGDVSKLKDFPGKDITTVLDKPQDAKTDALRIGALYNYNMFAYVDEVFFSKIGEFLANGGKPENLAKQGFRPNLKKRGAIRSIFDGRYKFNRYFSPLNHHIPSTLEQLFANNDLELFDIKADPFEMNNLAMNRSKHSKQIDMMNNKLNLLIKQEVGEDIGQMLPKMQDTNWRLDLDMKHLRL